jgi:hypothetical protein
MEIGDSGNLLFTMLIIIGIIVFLFQVVIFFIKKNKDDAHGTLIILRAAIVLMFGSFAGLTWAVSSHPIEMAISVALVVGVIVYLLLSLVTHQMEVFLIRLATKEDVRLNKELETHVLHSDVLVASNNDDVMKDTMIVHNDVSLEAGFEENDAIPDFNLDNGQALGEKGSPKGMKTVVVSETTSKSE